MFFFKQVLPIVLLSMAIGFAVTWFNWQSSNNDGVATEAAEGTPSQKIVAVSPEKKRAPAVSKGPAVPGPAINMSASRQQKPVQHRKTEPMKTVHVRPVVKTPPPAQARPEPEKKTQVPPTTAAATAAAAGSPVEDLDFVGSIESELNALKPARSPKAPVQQTASSPVRPATTRAVSSASRGSGWSAEHFMDVIKPGKKVVATQDPVTAAISRAARRSEQQASTDPYLNVLQDEASDLSVTAVRSTTDAEIIRNQPFKPTTAGSPGNEAVGGRYRTVEQGETLTDIAAKVYGDAAAYTRIYEANRDVLESPDSIVEGQTLLIPAP